MVCRALRDQIKAPWALGSISGAEDETNSNGITVFLSQRLLTEFQEFTDVDIYENIIQEDKLISHF